MSEIKQEILDLLILNGRKPQSIKSGERVVYLYDALNIVNKEFSKTDQPQLNENQETVLDYLKGIAVKNDNAPIVTFSAFGWQHFGAELPKNVEQAYRSMDGKQDLAVMSAYVNWALEQEEE